MLRKSSVVLIVFVLLAGSFPAVAQGPPAMMVRYTEVMEYPVRQSLTLPGTVEAPTLSPVASEVGGLVIRLVATEGAQVAKGSALAKLRTTNLEIALRAAQGQLKESQARRDRAERVLNRAKELFKQDLISPTDMDEANAEFDAWDGKVMQTTAEIERIELDLERCTIRSPIAGVVVAEHIEVGGWINVGDPVMDVLATDRLDVRVEVPARYFHLMKRGVKTSVNLGSGTVEGTVDAVIPRADPGSRVFPIKVGIDNTDGKTAAGMLVDVSLPVGEPRNTLIIPKDAVVAQGPAKHVLVIGDDGMAQMVPVVTGTGMGAWVAVEGELTVGQKVVTRGNERLFPGMPVQGEPLAYELP